MASTSRVQPNPPTWWTAIVGAEDGVTNQFLEEVREAERKVCKRIPPPAPSSIDRKVDKSMERDVGRTDAKLTFNVKASRVSERFSKMGGSTNGFGPRAPEMNKSMYKRELGAGEKIRQRGFQ